MAKTILGIKTDKGYYVTDQETTDSYHSSTLAGLFINSEKAEPTFHKHWFFIKNTPVTIQREVSQPAINHRYELKDDMFADKLQKVYLKDDVVIGKDDDYDNIYTEDFAKIKSLYVEKSDTQPNVLQDIDFEFKLITEISEISDPTPFSYKRAGEYTHKSYPNVTEKDIKRDMISAIITPSIAVHETPAKLSSKDTYDIVRAFIKENINPRVAGITSDYDFCFTVKKKITLAEEYRYQVDINNSIFNNRKRKPKYQTRVQTHKSVTVFEMTHANKNYEGYTPIIGFEADNDADLKEYIDAYLNHLMSIINEPLKECDCCKGVGAIYDEAATNERVKDAKK